VSGGGERQGQRETMDRFVKSLVKHGNSTEYAKKKARECAIRSDRREDSKKTR
jgi:hypothetical protein|tara:strand:- start:368 stop:526 length:159 start_codon:yes stop_codon:yes gene_type:complete